MTISPTVSLFASSATQISRLNDLRSTLDDLQRQVTTQKRHENFSGFGTTALNLQRLHTNRTLSERYISNIDTISARMDQMNKNMDKITEIANQLVKAIQLNHGSAADMAVVNQMARENLKFVQDLINHQSDDIYLFAGSDAVTPPFIDDSILNSNFQNQISLWLGGGQTTAQLTAATDSFSATNLGLSPGLAAAGAVSARIDHNLDVDYTIKADQDSFKDIINALTFAANLTYPDPLTDAATVAQFQDALSHITTITTRGIEGMNDTNLQLSSKFNLVKTIREKHVSDQGLYSAQIDKIEIIDPTNAIASMQLLQTQLTASYQVTRIVSELSLVNFL